MITLSDQKLNGEFTSGLKQFCFRGPSGYEVLAECPEHVNRADWMDCAATITKAINDYLAAALAKSSPVGEREAFEQAFDIPEGVYWNGTTYATNNHRIQAMSKYAAMFEAWQSRASQDRPASQSEVFLAAVAEDSNYRIDVVRNVVDAMARVGKVAAVQPEQAEGLRVAAQNLTVACRALENLTDADDFNKYISALDACEAALATQPPSDHGDAVIEELICKYCDEELARNGATMALENLCRLREEVRALKSEAGKGTAS